MWLCLRPVEGIAFYRVSVTSLGSRLLQSCSLHLAQMVNFFGHLSDSCKSRQLATTGMFINESLAILKLLESWLMRLI